MDEYDEYYDYYEDGNEEETYCNVGMDDGNALQLKSTAMRTVNLQFVEEALRECVDRVTSVTCLSAATALLLLKDNKWIPESVNETYFSNPEAVLKSLKLTAETATHVNTLIVNREVLECGICCCEADTGEASAFSTCGHYFHNDCWKDAIHELYNRGATLMAVRCCEGGCQELITFSEMLSLYSGKDETEMRKKMAMRSLKTYVDECPRFCRCANPHECDGIIYMPAAVIDDLNATCDLCGYCFCVKCYAPSHCPCTCGECQEWLSQLMLNTASVAFINQHTKRCPNCHSPIQKNNGCNHITCTVKNCNYQFCWVCLGNWAKHHGDHFSCGNATPGLLHTKESSTGNDEKLLLDTLAQYTSHLNSEKQEQRTLTQLLGKAEKMTMDSLSEGFQYIPSTEILQLLAEMRDVLRHARTSIAWAFVRAYFSHKKGRPNAMLNHRCGVLVETTEALSNDLNFVYKTHPDLEKTRQNISKAKEWIRLVEERE